MEKQNNHIEDIESPTAKLINDDSKIKIRTQEYCTCCGNKSSSKKICEHCDTRKGARHYYCAWCGSDLPSGSQICDNCGEKIDRFQRIKNAPRIFFATFLFFLATLNFFVAIVPAIFFLLFAVLLLPVAKKFYLGLTHGKISLRKKLNLIISPLLVVCIIINTTAFMNLGNYETGVEEWNAGSFANAMYHFNGCKNYKDTKDYIEEFESEVTSQLIESLWYSFPYGLDGNGEKERWHYQFNSDGTALLRKQQLTETQHSCRVASYQDHTYNYTFEYVINSGLYDIQISVGGKSYSLLVVRNDDGNIELIHFSPADPSAERISYSRDYGALPKVGDSIYKVGDST